MVSWSRSKSISLNQSKRHLGWHVYETTAHSSDVEEFIIKSYGYLTLHQRIWKVYVILFIFTMFKLLTIINYHNVAYHEHTQNLLNKSNQNAPQSRTLANTGKVPRDKVGLSNYWWKSTTYDHRTAVFGTIECMIIAKSKEMVLRDMHAT